MHDSLLIPELYEIILASLKSDTHSLLSLALTCSQLSERALDRLWENQRTLSNLLNILPFSIQEALSERYGALDISGSIVPNDTSIGLQRLTYYSRRLRQLKISQEADVSAMRKLSKLGNISQHLFPGLMTVRINCFPVIMSVEVASLILSLIGASLLRLEIVYPGCGSTNSFTKSFFPAVPSICPNIQVFTFGLSLWGGSPDQPFWTPIDSMLGSLHNLQVIDVDRYHPSPNFLKSIARFPPLTTLRTLHITSWTVPELRSLGKRLFPGVLDLKAEVVHWPGAADIFELLERPLHTLAVQQPSDPWANIGGSSSDPSLLPLISTFFQKAAQYTNLRNLKISLMMIRTNENTFPHHIFDSLFSMTRLQKLDISSQLLQDAGDEWLLRVADAFPYLESLKLGGYLRTEERRMGEEVTLMTLKGLLPLIHKCPKLNQMDVLVTCEPFDANDLGKMELSRVQSVTFTHCPISEDVEGVLKCIMAMFPYASIRNRCAFRRMRVHHERWKALHIRKLGITHSANVIGQ